MDYYNLTSKGYDELYKDEQLSKIKIIKENIKISKSTKLLDVGCGTGFSSDFGCFVAGIDPSIGLLNQNKIRNKVLAAAESIPFKDDFFDYVVSVTAIHNFSSIEKAMKEIKRVGKRNFVFSILKKAGKFSHIRTLIESNFKISKVVEEEKDTIFFCEK